MHVTQDLNFFGEIITQAQCSVDEKNIYIPCVPHKNNCNNKIGSHGMKQTDSSIIIVRNVCVLTSASMIVYLFFMRSWLAIVWPKLFFTRSWSAIIGTKQPKVNQSPQPWRERYTCTRICRFLVVGNIFRLEICMNSLVKVLPYSKLNFQGKFFFTQNWCNIILRHCTNFIHLGLGCLLPHSTIFQLYDSQFYCCTYIFRKIGVHLPLISKS